MSESEPVGKELQVVAHKRARTDLGVVVRFDVLSGDTHRTVYSSRVLTAVGLEQLVADIASAEKWAQSLIVRRRLRSEGLTVKKLAEQESDLFLEGLRTNRYSRWIHEGDLTPLVKQEAMRKLFDQAVSETEPHTSGVK